MESQNKELLEVVQGMQQLFQSQLENQFTVTKEIFISFEILAFKFESKITTTNHNLLLLSLKKL